MLIDSPNSIVPTFGAHPTQNTHLVGYDGESTMSPARKNSTGALVMLLTCGD